MSNSCAINPTHHRICVRHLVTFGGVTQELHKSKKTKKACIAASLSYSGSPTWTRTRDLRINSACASVEGINQKFAFPLKSYTYTAGKSKHPQLTAPVRTSIAIKCAINLLENRIRTTLKVSPADFALSHTTGCQLN